jgi:glycosyltransferase involved in cell wall biosynthesis
MRIGIDTSQAVERRAGCGQFAASLVDALAAAGTEHSYLLYATFGPSWTPEAARTFAVDRPNFERRLADIGQRDSVMLWRDPAPDFRDRIGRPDVVHSNFYFCPPVLRPARLVYTVHDLVSLDHPEYLVEENRVNCATGLFDASIRADLVIAVSDFTRGRFLEWFPHYPPGRVRTVREGSRFGPGHPRRPPAAGPPLVSGEFFLTVGTLEPRKNLRRVLKAYARLRRERNEVRPLVVAGPDGWMEDDLPAAAAEMGLQDAVHFAGYVDDPTLCWLYANCLVFVYVSLAEGFGLPPLEAMSLGAPVLASSTSSLPEVCGDAALFVDPADERGLFDALSRLAGERALREGLRERALAQASRYSWDATARETLRLYEEVVASEPLAPAPRDGPP